MNYRRQISKQAATLGVALLVAFASTQAADAFEADGPHLQFKERNAAAWAEQDTAIDARLAALEQRTGKKPNIIYILTDDIGWVKSAGRAAASIAAHPRPLSTRWLLKACGSGRPMPSRRARPPVSPS